MLRNLFDTDTWSALRSVLCMGFFVDVSVLVWSVVLRATRGSIRFWYEAATLRPLYA